MRLSPFDPWAFAAYDAQALGHFRRGRYADAASAAYKSNRANPAHSITHVQIAAALAKLGRLGRPGQPRPRCCDCIRRFATAGNSPVLTASRLWQPRWPRP
jgi:hypothetical protein